MLKGKLVCSWKFCFESTSAWLETKRSCDLANPSCQALSYALVGESFVIFWGTTGSYGCGLMLWYTKLTPKEVAVRKSCTWTHLEYEITGIYNNIIICLPEAFHALICLPRFIISTSSIDQNAADMGRPVPMMQDTLHWIESQLLTALTMSVLGRVCQPLWVWQRAREARERHRSLPLMEKTLSCFGKTLIYRQIVLCAQTMWGVS